MEKKNVCKDCWFKSSNGMKCLADGNHPKWLKPFGKTRCKRYIGKDDKEAQEAWREAYWASARHT